MALLKYPLDVGDRGSEYPHTIHFSARRRNLSSQNQQSSRPQGDVVLFLPADALKTSYSQTYGDSDLGAVGAGLSGVTSGQALDAVANIERTIQSATGGAAGAALGAAGSALSAATGAFGGIDISSALAQATVNEAVGGLSGPAGNARDAILKKAGRIINPHKAVIYQGPGGFRVFNYSFSMSPESKTEADTISKIVYYFKYHMHPGIPTIESGPNNNAGAPVRTSTGGNINSSVTLSYPEEFTITARVNFNEDVGTEGNKGNATTIRPLFKIDKCFLESLSVDYSTSGGPAFIRDESTTTPATTTLTLQFKETVLMTKEKISRGF